ncbi:hypothetical protein DNI29_20080 [Hymenobacter sediminis]|uniref:hypothetical protein n=1 Tax=Hymenobacter sediminis TaxID=2218621 RepID=UPI000DA6C5D8|nr:hypothetical protein [Hymenobacter sediminis]RPD44995.1 hypothetical protein DNI29_20080 [Hymenobacter sediminis]
MQKRYTLFYLLLLCVAASSFRIADWNSFAVDERLSVRLPAQPQQQEMPSPVKMFTTNDVNGKYVIVRTELGPAPSGKEQDWSSPDRYYDAILDGFGERSGAVVLNRSTFTLGGFNGIEFDSKAITPTYTGRPAYICVRCLLVNDVVYMLQFIPTDATGKTSKIQRAPFFNSLVLKPGSAPGKQPTH